MIHELLLALSGYPGSIFTWNKRSGLQVLSASARELARAERVEQASAKGRSLRDREGGACTGRGVGGLSLGR